MNKLANKIAQLTCGVFGMGHALDEGFVQSPVQVAAVDLDTEAVAEYAARYGRFGPALYDLAKGPRS